MRFIFQKRMFFLILHGNSRKCCAICLRFRSSRKIYYTTTRDFRELQQHVLRSPPGRLIPQQETLGNYNFTATAFLTSRIIPQQETLGNYNIDNADAHAGLIIPQQETSSN